MKNYGILLVLCSGITYSNAQDYSIVERGAHHRVWQSTTETRHADGRVTIATNSYTELATGICYEDPTRPGRWLDTRAEFALVPGKAVARFGPHQLTLDANINSARPVVVVSSDGKRFTSKPWGLVFREPATGKQVLVAEVKDASGVLVAPNTVVYADAFTDCKAALRYTYTYAGCEQDVIFMDEGFGRPEEYGLKGEDCVLEMWTEFIESPAARKSVRAIEEGLHDETLEFGEMRIRDGRAFMLDDADDTSIPVAKTWIRVEGRTFLAEAVRYPRIRPMLDRLQARAGNAKPQPVKRLAKVVNDNGALVAQFVRPDQKEQLIASAMIRPAAGSGDYLAEPAVVLDYTTVNSSLSSPRFTNETYWVTGAIYLSGQVVFEVGAVFKYNAGTFLQVDSTATVEFNATPYRPVIFTAKDDNSVGQILPGSNGNPGNNYYANPALRIWFNSQANYNLSNLRIRNAQLGLSLQYDGNAPNLSHIVRHAQFVKCQAGLAVHYSSATGVKLQNALFHNVNKVFSDMYYGRVDGEHVTVNGADYLNYNPNSSIVILRNSLLVNVTTPGSYSGSGNAVETSGTAFQSAGDGMHYLAAGSPHRNPQGTAVISPDLALEFKRMTTYPPLTLASPVSVPTTLVPQAPRDTDVPDRGFHYWPLDYIADRVVVSASLALANGVALGVKGWNGLDVYATVSSEGTPLGFNTIVSCQNVQEQGGPPGGKIFMRVDNPSYSPVMRFRFTEFSVGQGAYGTILDGGSSPFQELTLRDCWLRGADWNLWPATSSSVWIGLTNNLIEWSSLAFNHWYYSINTPLSVGVYNNLFRHGGIRLEYHVGYYNPNWYIRDNLFDQATQSVTGNGTSYIVRSHNGFTVGTANSLAGTSDPPNFVPDYVPGPLGNYYYPTTGPGLNSLRDVGSRTAIEAGLSHYTTTGAKEQVQVDIGFHYVVVDSSQNNTPFDNDGDWLTDYLEDSDGDSNVDPGESNWQTSINGLTATSTLDVFTPLK